MMEQTRRLARDLRTFGNVVAPTSLRPAVLIRTGLADGYWTVTTPIGPVFVAANDHGIAAVVRAEHETTFEHGFADRVGRRVYRWDEPPTAVARGIRRWLEEGGRSSLRFDLRGRSEFERAVLLKALEIPRGEVRPYGWVAREIGRPQAVRAVGTVLGRNPVPLLIPCHRVVRSDGTIGDYVFGSDAKRVLLTAEKVVPEELAELARTGVRVTGSDTTRIFCHPTCRHARRTSARHTVNFASAEQAFAAGYRPCKVCRPAAVAS